MPVMINPFDTGGYTLAEMTEAININNASPIATARAEKNVRRRLRPRSRKAILKVCIMVHLYKVKGFCRFASSSFHCRD